MRKVARTRKNVAVIDELDGTAAAWSTVLADPSLTG